MKLEHLHQFAGYSARQYSNGVVVLYPDGSLESGRAHVEDICQRCGCLNIKSWHAPSPIWNRVMERAGGRGKYSIVCPRCFAVCAEEEGVEPTSWCFTIHKSELERIKALAPSGWTRRFDWEECLWVDE